MDTQTERVARDKALIEELGGPAKLAGTLGYSKDGGIQRVQNWMTRGIPSAVKVMRPDLFLRGARKTKPSKPLNTRSRPAEERAEAGEA